MGSKKLKNPRIFNSKIGISPLIATVLLIAFALLIGAATMNWGKSYVKEPLHTQIGSLESAIIISTDKIDSPLKELQIKFITGKITLEEYLATERGLLNNG